MCQLALAIAARGSVESWRFDRLAHHIGKQRRIVGDQDRLRAFVMLGLGEQVGGDPVGIVLGVGDDQHFRRAGDHVDADLSEHLALGLGDIGIAGADDLVDRRGLSPCHRRARAIACAPPMR